MLLNLIVMTIQKPSSFQEKVIENRCSKFYFFLQIPVKLAIKLQFI